MTHEAMLKKLGLTEAQFRDLLKKHADFMKALDTAQQKLTDLQEQARKAGAPIQ